jgi:hypothetical protein
MTRHKTALIAAVGLCACLSAPLHAQETGPIAPPPRYETKRIGSQPAPDAPPVPADQIIKQFTKHEDESQKAWLGYACEQTVRMQEFPDQGTTGEFMVSGELYSKPDGDRYFRVLKPPIDTLKITAFSLDDVKTFESLPAFMLVTEQLPHYIITYEGKEKLDELDTLLFRVAPKNVERKRLRFDGVVWVDAQDFVIVKSFGKYVTDVADEGTDLPFKSFETFRENYGKFWFPTYIHADEVISTKNGGELQLRLVAHATHCHPVAAQEPAAGASPAPSASPQTKPPKPSPR